MSIQQHGRRGFTLVELLVVIGIIAVLISILLPALNRARSQAMRVQCMSNVRSLNQWAVNYATNNRGYFPNLLTKAPSKWSYKIDNTEADSDKKNWITAIEREIAFKRDNFYCPANPEWNKDSFWVGNPVDVPVGYAYMGVPENFVWPTFAAGVQFLNPENGDIYPATDKRRWTASKLGQKPEYKVLWMDLTRSSGNEFYASFGSNHVIGLATNWRAEKNGKGGANVGYIDGHVEWVPQGELRPRWQNATSPGFVGWW